MTTTQQLTATLDGHVSTVLPGARHQHGNACYWDVDACGWRCAASPPVDSARCILSPKRGANTTH
jgi:hypothetical protein